MIEDQKKEVIDKNKCGGGIDLFITCVCREKKNKEKRRKKKMLYTARKKKEKKTMD